MKKVARKTARANLRNLMSQRMEPSQEWSSPQEKLTQSPMKEMGSLDIVTPKKEVRFTSATGGQKGRKPEQMNLLPYSSLAEIAKAYAYGAEKYSRFNYRAAYPWSWSYDALQRHLGAFWEGENNDPESGLNHLAHAGWHILTLLVFFKNNPDQDDRYKPEKSSYGKWVTFSPEG